MSYDAPEILANESLAHENVSIVASKNQPSLATAKAGRIQNEGIREAKTIILHRKQIETRNAIADKINSSI
jgi:hypothetical protein